MARLYRQPTEQILRIKKNHVTENRNKYNTRMK